MPTPQGIQTVTVHGRYVEPDLQGTPLQGAVTFTPNPSVITFPVQDTIMSGTETALLDADGEFTIELPCTDTPGQNPSGWTYTVTEKLVGPRQRTYQILLPYTLAVVEMSDIIPTETAPTYLPVTGPIGPPGLVTSVNGISAPHIILEAEDVDAVGLDQINQPSGVLGITADGRVGIGEAAPSSKLQVKSTSEPGIISAGPTALWSAFGARVDGDTNNRLDILGDGSFAWGPGNAVADTTFYRSASGVLTASGQIIATPASPTAAGHLTRKDYVDSNFVGVGSTQSITGAKTFTVGPLAQLSLATNPAWRSSVVGDTVDRLTVRGSGALEWSSGAATKDVTLQRGGTSQLQVVPSGNSSSSTSTGGTFNLNNTASTGAGVVVYSAQAAPAGHLIVARADNAAFSQQAAFIDYVGTSHAVVVNHKGTGAASSALSLSSTNPSASAVSLAGVETGGGTLKVVHTGSGADASASAVAIDVAGASTAAQGLSIDSSGNTTGDLIIARRNGLEKFAVNGNTGQVRIGADVLLNRSAAATLNNAGSYLSSQDSAASTAYATLVRPEGFFRYLVYSDGKVEWGPGTGARDVNLYRGGVDLLKTDDKFEAANFPSGAWQSWTPVWSTTTGAHLPSFGNATRDCQYTEIGKTVHFYMKITFGSTTNFGSGVTGSDNWTMTLPVPAAGDVVPVGVCTYKMGNTSDSTMGHMALLSSSSTVCQFYTGTGAPDGASVAGGLADSLSPRAWASGDTLLVTGTYQKL